MPGPGDARKSDRLGLFSRMLVRLRGLPFENELRLQVPKSLNGRCPMCAGKIEEHAIQVLGGTELDPQPAPDLAALIGQTQFVQHVVAHRWEDVLHSEIPQTRPALLALLLMCPALKESAVLVEAIPFTEVEKQRWVVWKVERVTPDDSEQLARLCESIDRIEL